MLYFWIFSIFFTGIIVYLFSRHFYLRRISLLHYTHNSAKNDFLNEINTSTVVRENFETILSGMVEGVLVINAKGQIEHASSNFCQLFELRSKETKGKLYWEVIWNQGINESIKEALSNKQTIKKEISILGVSDSFFSMQISPVRDKENKLISVIAIFHDITELKELEKVRADFVANVSHELKTPLTAIKGFVETLKTTAKDDPVAVERFLDIIDKQTQRLENLVNDLLIISSIESKEVKMNFMPESLTMIIQSVVSLQKKIIEDKNHQFTVDIPKNLPNILVDRQRTEQVFLNLLDNAVKYTPNGGKISIKAQINRPYVCVEVKDNGLGIPPEHLSRVFERFYRIDKSRSREAGGTGLGLSIVHQIISAHNGKIEVESSSGSGSTFRIFLPCQI